MDQVRTYSRKSRLTNTSDGAYKSSQESFVDSPDDPYSFDSQQSSFQISQSTVAVPSRPQTSSSTLDSASYSKPHVQPLPAKKAAAISDKQHKRKAGVSGILSRLSRSSSQETATQQKRTVQELPKNSCFEAPAAKRACVKRGSGTSVNQVRRNSGKSSADKKTPAPATTVLEVITCALCWYL